MSPEQTPALAVPAKANETPQSPLAESTAGIESSSAQRASGGERCENCEAPLSGRFCASCGQRRDHFVPSVSHFLREATEDLTHADSRVWRTILALLFKPGFLTREFLSGRRARYLPPLRLYLVVSVVFFLVIGSTQHEPSVIQDSPATEGGKAKIVTPLSQYGPFRAQPGETPAQREKRVCHVDYDGPADSVIQPLLMKGCASVLQDAGRTLFAAFVHNVPRAMFLFLPLLALVMMLMYWHPRRYYVEHLLFFVHNHAFVFVLFTLVWLVSRLAPSLEHTVSDVADFYVLYYLFVSMRRVYGQSRARTAVKFVVLACAYLFCALLMFAVTSAYTLLTL